MTWLSMPNMSAQLALQVDAAGDMLKESDSTSQNLLRRAAPSTLPALTAPPPARGTAVVTLPLVYHKPHPTLVPSGRRVNSYHSRCT